MKTKILCFIFAITVIFSAFSTNAYAVQYVFDENGYVIDVIEDIPDELENRADEINNFVNGYMNSSTSDKEYFWMLAPLGLGIGIMIYLLEKNRKNKNK